MVSGIANLALLPAATWRIEWHNPRAIGHLSWKFQRDCCNCFPKCCNDNKLRNNKTNATENNTAHRCCSRATNNWISKLWAEQTMELCV